MADQDLAGKAGEHFAAGCNCAQAVLRCFAEQYGLDADTALRLADHQENLARLNLSLPGFASGVDPSTLGGKVGFRPMSPDRLPILGAVPAHAEVSAKHRLPSLPRLPGLWCAQGYGARGIVWSALMADLLLSRLEGEPLPLETDLIDAVDPGRFLLGRATPPDADDA